MRNFINISSSYNLLDVIYTEISSTMKINSQFGLEKVPVSVTCYHLAKLIIARLISGSVTVAQWLAPSPTILQVAGSSFPTGFIFFNKFSLV